CNDRFHYRWNHSSSDNNHTRSHGHNSRAVICVDGGWLTKGGRQPPT
ncbi:MAG: hypothetical protein FD135_2870, partial [Comamonadaceae bacterium]